MLSSHVRDMFQCGEVLRSVLLLMRRRLHRFQVSLRDSEPIVISFGSIEFLGLFLSETAIIVLSEFCDDYLFLVVIRSGINSVYYG
jgi:hypothetical protein